MIETAIIGIGNETDSVTETGTEYGNEIVTYMTGTFGNEIELGSANETAGTETATGWTENETGQTENEIQDHIRPRIRLVDYHLLLLQHRQDGTAVHRRQRRTKVRLCQLPHQQLRHLLL